jgi:hypothetical protein
VLGFLRRRLEGADQSHLFWAAWRCLVLLLLHHGVGIGVVLKVHLVVLVL